MTTEQREAEKVTGWLKTQTDAKHCKTLKTLRVKQTQQAMQNKPKRNAKQIKMQCKAEQNHAKLAFDCHECATAECASVIIKNAFVSRTISLLVLLDDSLWVCRRTD